MKIYECTFCHNLQEFEGQSFISCNCKKGNWWQIGKFNFTTEWGTLKAVSQLYQQLKKDIFLLQYQHQTLQDKLSRRNMQIKELKKKFKCPECSASMIIKCPECYYSLNNS